MMHSRFCIAISTSSKSEALSAFKQAISYAGFAPKRLRSDNAKEFESAEFTDFCASHPVPIFREWSNPYQQHQNGVVEHMVHILTQKTRVFLLQSGLGPSFWSFALVHAVNVYNHLPHTARYREMWPPSCGLSVDPFSSTYVLLVVIVPS
jgi:transposase InsO family protein